MLRPLFSDFVGMTTPPQNLVSPLAGNSGVTGIPNTSSDVTSLGPSVATEPGPRSQAMHWAGCTLNNYTALDIEKFASQLTPICTYWVYGEEVAGYPNNTPHLQFMFSLKAKKTLVSLKKIFPTAHFEIKSQKSTFLQASFARGPGSDRRGAEIKAIDIPDGTYGFNRPNAGLVSLLNGVQTGTGFFNRIGSRIEMKSLRIRGFIYYALTSIQDQIRMIIVYDRQPTGALPAPTVILQTRDQAGAATNPGSSEINLDNRDRFTILRDIQLQMPSCTVAAGVLTNGPAYSFRYS